jgi:hypothetical protein
VIRTRTLRLAATVVLGAAAMTTASGCGGPIKAGAAVVVDGERTTDGQIQSQVGEIVSLEKSYGGTDTAPNAALAQSQVTQLIDVAVWQRVAAGLGVPVTSQQETQTHTALVTAARQAMAGSKFGGSDDEAIAVYELGQQNPTDVAPGGIATFVKLSTLINNVVNYELLKLHLSANDPNSNAALLNAINPLLEAAAQHVNATVSPRYGTYDARQLSVIASSPDWVKTVSASTAPQTAPAQ